MTVDPLPGLLARAAGGDLVARAGVDAWRRAMARLGDRCATAARASAARMTRDDDPPARPANPEGPEEMTETVAVIATDRGLRYHLEGCPAFGAGQLLNDWDCGADGPCYHAHPTVHFPQRWTPEAAAARGKVPCAVCKPPAAPGPAVDDFGHGPWPLEYVEVCSRCGVWWPCATAVVLGVAEEVPR